LEQAIDPINIGIAGAGRMGRAIMQSVRGRDDLRLASVWLHDEGRSDALNLAASVVASTDIERVTAAADVVIDFSLPKGTMRISEAVAAAGKPLVCGVSGLSDAEFASLGKAAATVAVVYDRNMSLGVAVLERIVRQAAASLGLEFAAEIHETHHVHKRDAPSGTALKLGEAVARSRGQDFDTVAWYAPTAGDRPLANGDIVFEVERRGEVPGDHSVIFTSATERLTLGHSVTTRQVFADGALRAASWAISRPPGLYSMRDVLFADD
jgi:4-hydroxy-tetrahydrodipicolinate reductase